MNSSLISILKMFQNRLYQGMIRRKALFVVMVIILSGVSVFSSCSKKDARKRMQDNMRLDWPTGTHELEWKFGGLQSTWSKVHLQMPDCWHLDSSLFLQYAPAYCKEYMIEMDEQHWNQQNRLWQKYTNMVLFTEMRHSPTTGTNLWFTTNFHAARSNTICWAAIFDENTKQMWIFCD